MEHDSIFSNPLILESVYAPTVRRPSTAVGRVPLASSTETISSRKRICAGRRFTVAYQHISLVVVLTKP